MINDTLFGENIKLSYSRLQLLKCPVKYYVTKFIGLQTYSIHSIIGIVVHKLYEELLLNEITIEQAKSDEVIVSYIDEIVNKSWFPIDGVVSDYEQIVKEVKLHIYNDLKIWVDRKVEDGYEFHIEKEDTDSQIEILNSILPTYIRPDIYLIKGDSLILVDIKTAKRYRPEFKSQLIFYMKLLADVNPDLAKFDGVIYFSRYGEIRKVYSTNNKQKLVKDFNKLIKQVSKFYTELKITNLKEIKEFVKKVNRLSSSELFDIRCKLYSEFGNICGFCPIKQICPICNLGHNPKYGELLTKGQSDNFAVEDKIVYVPSFQINQSELIGFVGSDE